MAKKVTTVKPKTPSAYKLPKYTSQYASAIDQSISDLTNFQYDPMQDASFRAMASWYNSAGEQAAKNTMGDVAATNGGYGSSYATSAAQQARNDYNQQLAMLVPEYEQRQYDRMKDKFGVYMDAENWKYGMFRDDVQDSKDKWNMSWNRYRDRMGDYQWGKSYNLDIDNFNLAKKNKTSGGGGGRGGSGGASGYSGYTGGGGGNNPITEETKPELQRHEEHGETYSTADGYNQRSSAKGRMRYTNADIKNKKKYGFK